MVNTQNIENINKFEKIFYPSKFKYSYEGILGFDSEYTDRQSIYFSSQIEITSLTSFINAFKSKKVFENDNFDKIINKIPATDGQNLFGNLYISNITAKSYFYQWVKKFGFDDAPHIKEQIETINQKLKEFDDDIENVRFGNKIIQELSLNTELYKSILPLYRHSLNKEINEDLNSSLTTSLYHIVTDKKFSKIMENYNYSLFKMNNATDKLTFLMTDIKKNIEIVVQNNSNIFSNQYSKDVKKLSNQLEEADVFFNEKIALLKKSVREHYSEIAIPLSEQYTKGNNSVSDFLNNKKTAENLIAYSIDFRDNEKINQLIIFNDESIGYLKKGEYKPVDLNDMKTLNALRQDVVESFISYELRRHPTVRNILINKYKEELPTKPSSVMLAVSSFVNNEQILKNLNITLEVLKNKSFESIDDAISNRVREYKATKMITNTLSNKYLPLYLEKKDEIDDIVVDLIDLGTDSSIFQNFIGKKLASIKDSDQLLDVIKKFKGTLDGFEKDLLLEKLQQFNIKPLEVSNDVFVFEVYDYEACKTLGSSSWCIVRDESYFNDYTEDGDRQYFIYDFNKDSSDNDSMMGFTLHPNGNLRTQHYKDDDYIEESAVLDKAQLTVLANDSSYNLSANLILKSKLADFHKQKININIHYNI